MQTHKLMATWEDDFGGEIWIRGDKAGLEFLAACCQDVIGKIGDAARKVLSWRTGEFIEGSLDVIIQYDEGQKKLKADDDKDKDQVTIAGNKEQLEYFAKRGVTRIGKNGPPAHCHFQWQMNTLEEPSIAIRLEYSDYPEDYAG